jgi:hypothetical protein
VTWGKAQVVFFGRRAAQSRALRPPFRRSPALLVIVYFAAAAVCTLLISQLPLSIVQFGLVGVGARIGSLWLDSTILASSTGLLIFGLAKRLLAAAEAAGLALTERDVAVGVIDISVDAVLVADIAKRASRQSTSIERSKRSLDIRQPKQEGRIIAIHRKVTAYSQRSQWPTEITT